MLSMPMFKEDDKYSIKALTEDLQNYWNLQVSDIEGDDKVATMKVNNQMVAISFMQAAIPSEDIESTAKYSYLWNNVAAECREHTSQAIISVFPGESGTLEQYKIYTMLNASLLRTSKAIGVYKGIQTLLLPRGLYIDFADFLLQEGMYPVQLWVYVGLVSDEEKNSAYTYGMKEFGKSEMEIVDSDLNLNELFEFLPSIISYVIGYDVTLKNNETIGFTEEQKIRITESKGTFLDENTLKLAL